MIFQPCLKRDLSKDTGSENDLPAMLSGIFRKMMGTKIVFQRCWVQSSLSRGAPVIRIGLPWKAKKKKKNATPTAPRGRPIPKKEVITPLGAPRRRPSQWQFFSPTSGQTICRSFPLRMIQILEGRYYILLAIDLALYSLCGRVRPVQSAPSIVFRGTIVNTTKY